MRSAGILLPISSLPNQYGIGTFGSSAYAFVDFLNSCKQTYWQILSFNHPSINNSLYQPLSVFGGNPYYIDLELLEKDGLLKIEEYMYLKTNVRLIDYKGLLYHRYPVLRKAYSRFNQQDPTYLQFITNNDWVNDYSLYMSIKNNFGGASWLDWPDEYKRRQKDCIINYQLTHINDINFYKFLQYKFYEQWINLKKYANDKGIKIIGDVVFYTCLDTCEGWVYPEQFLLDKNYQPLEIVNDIETSYRPSRFLGYPNYDNNYLAKTNYRLWLNRMNHALKYFDVVKICNFLGICSSWVTPCNENEGKEGKWRKGPGIKLIQKMNKLVNSNENLLSRIIIDDLSFLTEERKDFLKDINYPVIRVLEYGFNMKEDNINLPHNITSNVIYYPSTSDDPLIKNWYKDITDSDISKYVNDYLALQNSTEFIDRLLRLVLKTNAQLVIVQLQDYINNNECIRMNNDNNQIENTNWCWRVNQDELNPELVKKISYYTTIYKREKVN